MESHVGANAYRVKMGSKTKTYHFNMLKKYISREPDVEGNMVPVDSTNGATIALAGVIHQDFDPEQGEVPDLEGYRQREGVHNVKLGGVTRGSMTSAKGSSPEVSRCVY